MKLRLLLPSERSIMVLKENVLDKQLFNEKFFDSKDWLKTVFENMHSELPTYKENRKHYPDLTTEEIRRLYIFFRENDRLEIEKFLTSLNPVILYEALVNLADFATLACLKETELIINIFLNDKLRDVSQKGYQEQRDALTTVLIFAGNLITSNDLNKLFTLFKEATFPLDVHLINKIISIFNCKNADVSLRSEISFFLSERTSIVSSQIKLNAGGYICSHIHKLEPDEFNASFNADFAFNLFPKESEHFIISKGLQVNDLKKLTNVKNYSLENLCNI